MSTDTKPENSNTGPKGEGTAQADEQKKSERPLTQRLITLFEVSAGALQEKGILESATIAVTELAARLKCERVSIGFMVKKRIQITALSHSAGVEHQANLTSAIAEAMEEAADQRVSLVFPASPEAKHVVLRAHNELAARFGSAVILTVPFFNEKGEAYGAFTFERATALPFGEKNLEVCEAVAPFVGAILYEKQRNDQPLYQKALESLDTMIAKVMGPAHSFLRFCLCSLAVIILFCCLVKGEYRVSAPTLLEGTIQQVVIAPFDGFLEQAFFRAGDVVQKDQIMARLDSRDFNLERMNWASRIKQRTFEYHKARSDNEIALSNIIEEQMHQATIELSLLEENISRAKVRAPFAGYVISGDLSQALGAPLERGQVLFEVAPLNSYRVMLEVDEKDIAQVGEGQSGKVALSALSDTTLDFIVKKITPVSRSREGRNFFMVEATLTTQSDRLRPGMRGYGKISIGRRSLVWIWTHELSDRLRLWFWTLIP